MKKNNQVVIFLVLTILSFVSIFVVYIMGLCSTDIKIYLPFVFTALIVSLTTDFIISPNVRKINQNNTHINEEVQKHDLNGSKSLVITLLSDSLLTIITGVKLLVIMIILIFFYLIDGRLNLINTIITPIIISICFISELLILRAISATNKKFNNKA